MGRVCWVIVLVYLACEASPISAIDVSDLSAGNTSISEPVVCAPFILLPELGFRTADTPNTTLEEILAGATPRGGCTNLTVLVGNATCDVSCADGYYDPQQGKNEASLGTVSCKKSGLSTAPMRADDVSSNFVCIPHSSISFDPEIIVPVLGGLAGLAFFVGAGSSSSGGSSSGNNHANNNKETKGNDKNKKDLEEDSEDSDDGSSDSERRAGLEEDDSEYYEEKSLEEESESGDINAEGEPRFDEEEEDSEKWDEKPEDRVSNAPKLSAASRGHQESALTPETKAKHTEHIRPKTKLWPDAKKRSVGHQQRH